MGQGGSWDRVGVTTWVMDRTRQDANHYLFRALIGSWSEEQRVDKKKWEHGDGGQLIRRRAEDGNFFRGRSIYKRDIK